MDVQLSDRADEAADSLDPHQLNAVDSASAMVACDATTVALSLRLDC